MKNLNLISMGTTAILAVILTFSVSRCDKNADRLKTAEAERDSFRSERNRLAIKNDSLARKAAADCDKKIKEALKINSDENLPDKPVKPDHLK